MKVRFTSISKSVFVLGLGISFAGFAQVDSNIDQHQVTVVIPTVALLDLETSGSKNITATFTASDEAGDKIVLPGSNTTLWLNYSSIQTDAKTKRVDVEASTLVGGVDITLTAGACGTGAGTVGTSQGTVSLALTGKKLIDGIGSAYTVSGVSKGHQLTYAFVAADGTYGDIRSGSTAVTVKYTLSEN